MKHKFKKTLLGILLVSGCRVPLSGTSSRVKDESQAKTSNFILTFSMNEKGVLTYKSTGTVAGLKDVVPVSEAKKLQDIDLEKEKDNKSIALGDLKISQFMAKALDKNKVSVNCSGEGVSISSLIGKSVDVGFKCEGGWDDPKVDPAKPLPQPEKPEATSTATNTNPTGTLSGTVEYWADMAFEVFMEQRQNQGNPKTVALKMLIDKQIIVQDFVQESMSDVQTNAELTDSRSYILKSSDTLHGGTVGSKRKFDFSIDCFSVRNGFEYLRVKGERKYQVMGQILGIYSLNSFTLRDCFEIK